VTTGRRIDRILGTSFLFQTRTIVRVDKNMAAKKKAKKTLLRKFSEDGYDYRVYEAETEVYVGRRKIGSIIGMKEQSGRHCFRLAFDSRSEPRTYRGRFYAAQALELIDSLVRESKKQRWSREELVIRSWDEKPRASQPPE
jgi:hypothetical protein